MKIVVACDSYKGCMTSKEVCSNIEKGIHASNTNHTVCQYPMADGGEGTASVYGDIIGGTMMKADCVDAYGKDIQVSYAFNGETAVIDVASCIGLNMYPKEKRNPMVANSRGVGVLMRHTIQQGCRKLIIGLGGSCTNDGGMGLLSEFGVAFYDSHRHLLEPSIYSLNRIAYIDKTEFKRPDIEMVVICDVKNHLLGPEGATYIFGRQKGIFMNQMHEIDGWMKRYNAKICQTFHVDMNNYEGSGAAGGIGGVLLGLFHARREEGVHLLVKESRMEKDIEDCDLVITGEGQTDAQTMYGKVPFGIASLAKQYGKPAICLSGALGKGYQRMYGAGIIGIFSTADRAMTFQQALSQGPEKLEALAYNVIHMIDDLRKEG